MEQLTIGACICGEALPTPDPYLAEQLYTSAPSCLGHTCDCGRYWAAEMDDAGSAGWWWLSRDVAPWRPTSRSGASRSADR